ncbi:hypothetical protein VP01_2087g1 [Puccinia sorghi]|uniref:Uncharacterized protein n=1 Tax=Puccinia sorghi TaxID=27349 RepID=A0A0L6VAX7_9BASI|nr:hypothetical protein VP01_2087g1 [Puccinia sorghi]
MFDPSSFHAGISINLIIPTTSDSYLKHQKRENSQKIHITDSTLPPQQINWNIRKYQKCELFPHQLKNGEQKPMVMHLYFLIMVLGLISLNKGHCTLPAVESPPHTCMGMPLQTNK